MHHMAPFVFAAFVSTGFIYAQNERGSDKTGDRDAHDIVVPGRHWDLLGAGYHLTADSAVDNDGNVYFTDVRTNRILKISPDGKISTWNSASNGSHGIAFGPDGRLYAGQHDLKRIVAFSNDGKESVIAEGRQSHHLTVTSRNHVYFTEPPARRVWVVDSTGQKRVVHEGMKWPRGVSASMSRLVVSDGGASWVWAFDIQGDGSLRNGRPFYRLETSGEKNEADAGGMAFDSEGFLYVATNSGVQVFDKRGRLTALIAGPGSKGVSNVFFAGPGLQWLYVTDWENVYRRPVKRTGALSSSAVGHAKPRVISGNDPPSRPASRQ